MKILYGKAQNINNDTLGKITFKHKNVFSRSNYIYVTSNKDDIPLKYLAILSEFNNEKLSIPYIGNISNISELNENDIVLINSKGEICVLYEFNATSNVIIATERCNHRCIMCPQPPIDKEDDKTKFNLRLIDLIDKRTKELGISGGEPTMVGDNLFVLIKHIQEKLPKVSVSLLSNGVMFADNNYAKKLANCNHFDLQIDVPLFSDIDNEHNRIVGANTFYKTINGLYNLALYKQKVAIRVVIHKYTYQRLPQLAEFIYRNFPFVCHIAFMQMETIGLADKNIKDLWIDPHDYLLQLKEAIMILDNRGMNTSIYNTQLCLLPFELHKFAKKSISEWKKIYLPECENCTLLAECPGLFSSSKETHSKYIKAII